MAKRKAAKKAGRRGGGGFSAASVKSIVRSVASAARGGSRRKGGKRRGGFKGRRSGGFAIVPTGAQLKSYAMNGALATGGFVLVEKGIDKLAEQFPQQSWMQEGWGRVAAKAGVAIVGGGLVSSFLGRDKGIWIIVGGLVAAGLDAWDVAQNRIPAARISGVGAGELEYRYAGVGNNNALLPSEVPSQGSRITQPGLDGIGSIRQPGMANLRDLMTN